MDRRGAAVRHLKGAAFLLIATPVLATSAPRPPLAALRWTEPALALDAATRQPPECLAPPPDPADRARVEVGRAAFRTPLLLGGQAARLGLSCDSCHTNGRGNPAFRFRGLSGAAGTADVTAPLMSAHRGDDLFDPRPIPDLARPGKISRAPGDPALGKFIRGLIVEEFDGREPPAAVLDGLVDYVRAIDARACPARFDEPVTAAATGDAAARAVAAARERLAAGDLAGARLMVGAARSMLGRLAERYAALPRYRARLLTADRGLQAALDKRDSRDAGRALSSWLRRSASWRGELVRAESRSLYDRTLLAATISSSTAAPDRPDEPHRR